jgi:hypothetical protein
MTITKKDVQRVFKAQSKVLNYIRNDLGMGADDFDEEEILSMIVAELNPKPKPSRIPLASPEMPIQDDFIEGQKS